MFINRNNYEIWFIEFFEGTLDLEEKKELWKFLEKNPGKQKEFNEFKRNFSNIHQSSFKYKQVLKKEMHDLGAVNDNTIDEFSIAYLENDLNEGNKASLLKAINENEDYLKIFKTYQLTKLIPDSSISYKFKSRLKHYPLNIKTITRVMVYVSAAAFLLFALLFFIPGKINNEKAPVISETLDDHELDNKQENKKSRASSKEKTETIKTDVLTQQGSKKPESGFEESLGKIEEDASIPEKIHGMENTGPKENNTRITTLKSMGVTRITYDNQRIEHLNIRENPRMASPNTSGKSGDLTNPDGVNDEKLTIWKIAELGLKGFNKLNETNYMLQKNYNAFGEVTSVSLITRERIITTSAI